MAGNYENIENRPTDKERQNAYKTGVGGYGGEDTAQPDVRLKSLPKAES